MLNRVILQGRLTADPELRYTQSGTPVATFRIACERGFKSNDPNAQTADFITIVAWRKTAEFIQKYFFKGSMILIDGRLQVRSYTDNSGGKRYVTEVIAESVNFAASRKESEGGQQSYQQTAQQPAYQQQNAYAGQNGNTYQQGYPPQSGAQQPAYSAQTSAYQQGCGYQQSGQQGYQQAAPYGQNPGYAQQGGQVQFSELDDDDGELHF